MAYRYVAAAQITAACLFLFTSLVASAQPTVPLYGVFETALTNTQGYANPFADVTLNATFTAPSGRKVLFFGFYDGDGNGGQTGNVWKLRFMPDEVGTWAYTAAFSDGRPGTTGSFTAVSAGAKPGPLRVDLQNPRWFVFANGQRFYLRGYYYSEAFTATDEFWRSDLDNFFGPTWKFNFISTIFWQGALLDANNWNARPYNGFYPVIRGDVTRFDLSAWHHVDEVIQHLSALGTVWYNFDGFVPNVGGDRPKNATEEEIMLRNWVARIAPYWNVTWNIAFEWSEFMTSADVNRIARYVKGLDPWNHLMTVHNQGIGTEPTGSGDWLDFYSIQKSAGTAGTAGAGNSAVVTSPGDKPVYAQEVVWEGEQDGKLNENQVRQGGWGVVTGAGLLNYAEQFRENGGFAYGDGGGFPYVKIMFDTIEGLKYWEMRPRNDLVSSAYCLANAGQAYLVYDEGGGALTVDLSDAPASAVFSVRWTNPRTGAKQDGGTTNGGSLVDFNAPFSGDSVLVLQQSGTRPLPPTGLIVK
jgi:Domain of unknown function (DUF5060)/Protein of unknown function (DUF4038)/Putative collagen-binding domain of a collagenase